MVAAAAWKKTWPFNPTSLSNRSLWKPLNTDITTMSAVTPSAMPRNEMTAMTDTEPEARRARR